MEVTLVLCGTLCVSVSLTDYGQGDFVVPSCSFSKSGYMSGPKAAVVGWTLPRTRPQGALAQTPALPLPGGGRRANPFTGLSLSVPLCRLWVILPPSACFGVYEVSCASFKLLNWIFQHEKCTCPPRGQAVVPPPTGRPRAGPRPLPSPSL